MYTEQLDAQEEVEKRIYGYKVRIGKARAAAQHADTLEQKIRFCKRVKSLQKERGLLYRNYWAEVDKLVLGFNHNKIE